MRKKIAAGIVFGSILLGLPWGVLAATGDTGREPARTGDRGLAGSLPTRDAVSGRPAGGAIWTDEQVARIPDTREYLHRASPEARQRLAVFHGRYPDVDVTDASAFHEALISERGRKGFQVPEAEWSDYVAWTSETEAMQQSLVKARGLHAGLPIDGIDESGRGYTLIGFEGNLPVYNYTLNREAAVSSAASFVRMNSDFDALFGPDIDGSGLWVNVNDHGTIYDEHPEFSLPDDTSRIVLKEINDSGVRTHMTHVAGTVAAHGYEERAMGMAPRTWIRALIQQSTAHVLNYGMQTNGQAERSVVGNTSLGSPTDTPGMYTANDRTFDQALWDTPYYLHFYAAGNEGTGGFNTLTIYGKVCKNLITVGAVNDVARNADGTFSSGGAIAYFSSRGPARDGRIKPDIVANGVGLYSTGTSTGYSSMSGTSMASPNAAGSALLLVDYFTKRFPGQYPRASTVKALIINTTDDLGNPGPDYTYGWGLINTLRAAEIIKRQADHSASGVLVEDVLNSKQIVTMPYRHDGSGPIRVTLCWTDVAGSTQRNYNDQSPRLVNNLHLRLVGPGGESYYPYVMPYVTGTDTVSAFDASLYDATAVTGVNNTDNVIQVLIEEPPAGDYTIEITHAGNSLSGQQQAYSLAVSGMVYWDGTITPPEVPTSLTYPPSSSTGVYTVTWTAVGEADLYELERSSDEGTLWTQVYEGSGTLHDESIISNGSYRYRVRAINLAGPSDWLAGIQDCVVDIPVPLSSPSSLTYPTGSSTGRYHVIWTDVEGADHYDLERSADARKW